MATSTKYQPRGSKDKLIKSVNEAKGSLEILSSLIKAKETEDDSTLIDIKVTNPLKRIYELLQDIKKHQSTTFSLRFTIPIIALPIFLFVAFQLGRGSYVCTQDFTSKKGIIKLIKVDVPAEQDGFISKLWKNIGVPSVSGISSEYVTEERVLLDTQMGNIIHVMSTKAVDMQYYKDQTVVITGTYSSCTNTITLNSENNIAIY